MLLVVLFLVVTAVNMAQAVIPGISGDSYSCFTNFQSVSTEGCLTRNEDDDGTIVQTTLQEVESMDFCVSGPTYGQTKQGSFGKAKNYAVSADLKMTDLGKYSTSYGFLGIAFNMMDSKNYDIAYVRPHAKDHCWELGYVENGLLFGRDFGTCSKKILSEFNLVVKIENGQGAVYVNGAKESDFTPFFPPSNKVATAMRNNMKSKMQTRNLEICQEINCVSRSESGKTMITKPLDSYRDSGMSECEACTCQLYGMIRCGCRSAEEQGVTCAGNMLAAVGHDCCARCVPPSATCYGSGDPHYKSWDGRTFDYQGRCTYTMVKTLDFEVRQKNVGYHSVALTEYCIVVFDGDQYKMSHGINYTPAGGTSQPFATPFKKYYNSEDYVSCVHGQECSIYIKNQKMVTVQCYPRGAINLWIHGTYYERTEGICGSWDSHPNNDFKNKDGQAVGGPTEMGNSFRVSNNNDGCPNAPEPVDPCDLVSRAERNWAEQYCSRYKQEPFKSCPVDVTQSFENCLFDACIDPDDDGNVCANAAAYAKQCADSGNPVVGWRSNSFCPLECPDTMVYDSCGKGCFATCADPSPDDCQDSCVEGCYCPQGTVLQDGQCVDSVDCQCMHEGKFIDNGASWNDTNKCETCLCGDGGIVDCDPMACTACPTGQVPVSKTGQCCPVCLADWTDENAEKIELKENGGPATMQCVLHESVLVSPDDITWKLSNGDVLDPEGLPDNFKLSEDRLTLTINPVYEHDDNDYKTEIVFNGVVGECKFDMVVIPIPPADYIDIDGESPRVVMMGECQTMSVKIVSDDEFDAEEFKWVRGVANKPVDFEDEKFTLQDGGKTVKVCDADDDEEGKYTVCVTKEDFTDCVDIELEVIAICHTDEGDYEELESWDEGEFELCTCNTEGEIECECKEQDVTCEEGEEMYTDENCQQLCAKEPATCLVTGDPHYKSFDGHRHDFQGGNCRFTVIKTEDFEVIGTNKHRGDNKNVAWNDAVEIIINKVKVYLGPEGELKVNGKKKTPPYAKIWPGSAEEMTITKAGESLIVKLKLNDGLEALDLIWDGNSTVSSTIHGMYYQGTTGLCGSWDDNAENDQISSVGENEFDDLNEFGWSWKIDGEVCEEEPQPPHPCDDSFFPEAEPIADEACDILMAAPFSDCHEVVDVETALYNCKYDTCSCFDASCACHAVKEYVKECQEKGVTTLGAWRDKAPYCTITCPEGFSYDSCGSFCPATCGDKNPDCGKQKGKCNEGCFCPKGMFLVGDECVEESECQCEHDGEVKEIGSNWEDEDICKDCVCRDGGVVVCEKMKCKACPAEKLPVYEDGECCPKCVEDWLSTEQESFEDIERLSDLTISCTAVVEKAKVQWLFSNDDGENWEEIEGANKFEYTIDDITEENDGQYKCKARASFKTREEVISVKTVDAGPKKISFGVYEVKPKKNKANLVCEIKDPAFDADADVKFYWMDKGKQGALISDKPKFASSKGSATYSLVKVSTKKKPTEIACIGVSADGKRLAEGKITLVKKKKKNKPAKAKKPKKSKG